MKILIAGNLANMGYEIAKAMRKKGVDVKLLLPKYPKKYEDPKNMYPELEQEGFPDWLVRYDNYDRSFGLKNWKFQIIKEMRKKEYDVIIALTEFSIFAMFSGKPYGALSTGSDMRELSFERTLKGFLYRLSYKKARAVIWGEPDKFKLLKKLGILKKSVFTTAPRNIDYKPQKVERNDLKNKFVIFHPVSQDWRLKNNQKFLRAFKKLCDSREDVHLIISKRGHDLEKAAKILSEGSSSNKFEFVPPLNTNDLQYYYNLADVIVDQFGIGSIGMITVEAMKCAKPVILEIDHEAFNRCYSSIPDGLINVNSEDAIYNELSNLVENRNLCNEFGIKNMKWVEENWDNDKLSNRYIMICNAIQENNLTLVGDPIRLF